MIRKYMLLAALLASTIGGFCQANLYEKQLFVSGTDTLPCRILTPKDFSAQKKYPLVILLHGAGERGNDNEKQLLWGGSLFTDSANRENFPAIVVFPQCPEGKWWAAMKRVESKDSLGGWRIHSDSPMTRPLQLVADFIDTLIAAGRVDPRRIYIGGLSMGGMGTFDMIVRRPDLFAAAFPICGGGDPDNILRSRKNLPIWIFHGAIDPVVPVAQSRLMVDILRKKNNQLLYTEYPGVQHDSWKNAFAEPELLPWLFSKRKR